MLERTDCTPWSVLKPCSRKEGCVFHAFSKLACPSTSSLFGMTASNPDSVSNPTSLSAHVSKQIAAFVCHYG